MAGFRKKLTMREIFDIVETEWSDEEDEVHTVTVFPPDNVNYITDEENLDDDVIDINNVVSASVEVARTLGYETRGDIESNKDNFSDFLEPFTSREPLAKTSKRKQNELEMEKLINSNLLLLREKSQEFLQKNKTRNAKSKTPIFPRLRSQSL
ncbi:hypothetical protein ACFFRR_011560 [Megaselia abdita]